jgi:hypothetical protein
MRAVRRYAVVVSVLFALGAGSILAGWGNDGLPGRQSRNQSRKETHRTFIQRILDYLDSKLSTPPG